MASVYQAAYERALQAMSSGNESSTDTGFCTSSPDDNKKIKSSRTIGYGNENENTSNYSNTYTSNQYNKHLTDNSSKINSAYPTSSRYSSLTQNTEPQSPQSPSSNFQERSSNRYLYTSPKQEEESQPANTYSSYRYSTPNRQRSNEDSVETTSSSNTNSNNYRYSSRNSHSPANLDTLSDTKENTAPVTSSLLGSVGYLGRYKPRYSSSSSPSNINSEQANTSDRTSYSVESSQPSSLSGNIDTNSKESTNVNNQNENSYTPPRYQYKSRAFNFEPIVSSTPSRNSSTSETRINNLQKSNEENQGTSAPKEVNINDYLYPNKYSSSTSTQKQNYGENLQAKPESTTKYSYPYRYKSNVNDSNNQLETQELKTDTNNKNVVDDEEEKVVTQAYTYRYPSGAYNFNIKTEPAHQKKSITDTGMEVKADINQKDPGSNQQSKPFRYPWQRYSSSTNSAENSQSSVAKTSSTSETAIEDEDDEEVFTETYTVDYKKPKTETQSVISNEPPKIKDNSSYLSTNSQKSPEVVISDTHDKLNSEDSVKNFQYKYRYPSKAYNYTYPKLDNVENKEKTDTTASNVSSNQSPNTASQSFYSSVSGSRYPSSSTLSGSTDINRQHLQTKEVLSPALAPRSPGTKYTKDDAPKYIFSMGSRTVIEPQSAHLETESRSEEVKEETVNETYDFQSDLNDNIIGDEEQDTENILTTQELLDKAQDSLEELHLVEAERLFLICYDKLYCYPENNHSKMIEIYFGLAEVCTRKSRQCRKSPLEWQWLCVHAAALLTEAAELCVLESKSDETFKEKVEYAENRNKSLEDLLSRTMYNWLSDGWRTIDPTGADVLNAKARTPVTSSNFPLSNMLGLKPYQTGYLAQALSIESLHEMPSSLEGVSLNSKSNWFKRIQLYCLKRLQNNNRQEVLDEVLVYSNKDSETCESQQLGSDDEGSNDQLTNVENTDSKLNRNPDENSDSLESESVDERKETVTALSEKPVKLTIAKVFHRVVIRLIQDQEYTKAELLCEEILQIIEDIQDGTIRMLKFNAELQQNLGILCLKQGDMSKGMACLEVALEIFRDLGDGDAHREVALVLIDMGNAYVSSSLSSDQIYQGVIAAIRVFFEKEACDDNDTGDSRPEMIRSREQEPTNKIEEKQQENINEAIKCYQEALEVLEENVQTELETIAKALMKLGDCYFIQTEYSKALDSYERAVPIFRKANVFGKDHFLQTGHVMLMLGVATFMLHVYPRAATTFEIAYTMVKHAHHLEINTFLHALLLSLMGIAYYKLKAYHKCVSLCYQAFDIFWTMHGEDIVTVPHERFWLVCQNLYILGNSYNVLNLQHKAIKYLDIGRAFMRATENGEKRQFIRILNILGDCYFAQYDYKTALVYYNEALEIGEPSKDETQPDGEVPQEDEMNQSSEDMALHNQLLSKSAEANISMNQYENAIEYLEQARDMQDALGEDIKGDLVSTLYQLGQMHSMAGDVDKAIDSYKDSLEVFRELHSGNLGPEMCVTLGNLATMCYVKACICEDIDSELQMILAAEGYFQDALKLELNQSVCVKYANFLYSQGNYDDAIMYLEDALKSKTDIPEIVYGGLEKVTLPEALQDEVDAQEEVEMPSVCLGHFLEVLSHKMLGQARQSDKSLIKLIKSVYDTDIPFLRSVLGYAFMEMGLFEEAAISFRAACEMDHEYHLAMDNYCLCLCLVALERLNSAFKNVFIHYKWWFDDYQSYS